MPLWWPFDVVTQIINLHPLCIITVCVNNAYLISINNQIMECVKTDYKLNVFNDCLLLISENLTKLLFFSFTLYIFRGRYANRHV